MEGKLEELKTMCLWDRWIGCKKFEVRGGSGVRACMGTDREDLGLLKRVWYTQ